MQCDPPDLIETGEIHPSQIKQFITLMAEFTIVSKIRRTRER